MKNYLGIDLGGSNLRIAKFDEDMNILEVLRIETEVEKGVDRIIDKIVNGINEIKDDNTQKIGISVPGQVDLETF